MAKKSSKSPRKPAKPAVTEAPAKPGRPTGAKTATDVARGELTRCAKCGSTEREPYSTRTEQAYKGTDADGQPYTHIVRRRTRCKKCGQCRVDRHTENRA